MRLHPSSEQTIAGIAKSLRSGERTCVSVVEQCLAEIDAWEPRVHAWVRLDQEGALAQARALDGEQNEGKYRGPLHGIPVGVKDLFDVAGWPTLAGTTWLTDAPATADAPIVARLRAAGAIILGKTVTTQFACFDPPTTRNPWNLDRTPGGSSSGSAAAVATGMCLGAVGSQTGGSIIRPASFCGVAGCKPTYRLLPLEGVYPLAASLDHPGPIARTVSDLALLLETLASRPFAISPRATPPRLGRLRGLFTDRAEPAALAVFESALDRMARAGAIISDFALPAAFDDVLACHRVIMTVEAARQHRQLFATHAADYLPAIRGLIEEGFKIAPETYTRCREHQQSLALAVATAMSPVDALVCPATVGPAPACDITGDPSFNAPWSYTGQPTVSFPVGLSAERLPLSFQLVGQPHDEARLLGVGEWCERQIVDAYS